MSKARSTGNLNNSILISDTGAITFVSGSTTLATLNTTGQLSGSAPVVFAATSSFANSFTVAGTLTAQTLVVQTVTSSVIYSSGSNVFGNSLANTQVMTGSVNMTGSLNIGGNVNLNNNNSILYWNNTGGGTLYGYIQGSSGLMNIQASASGDINFGNGVDLVRIKGNGNVGIGTTTPQSYLNYRILHVAGPIVSGSGLLYLTNLNNSVVGLAFAEGSANRVTFGSQTNHPVTFISNDTERIRITSTGLVGIGTNNPSSILDVASAQSLAVVRSTTTTNYAEVQVENTTNYLQMGVEGGSGNRMGGTIAYNAYLGSYSNYGMTFHTNNANRMTISNTGNVGINNSTPTGRIHIVSNNTPSISGTTPTGAFIIQSTATTALTMGVFENSPFYGWMQMRHGALADIPYGLAIQPLGGNVGIGTTSINHRLDVNGNINIPGGNQLVFNNEANIWCILARTNTSTTNLGSSLKNMIYCGGGANEGLAVLGSGYNAAFEVSNNGNAWVRGTLTKGGGSFRIDHPLPEKKDTHYLYHSFIEGPKADLIYRGKIHLVNGTATVNIDEVSTMTEGTFELLTRDAQCFVNNLSGWDLVKGSITGNILTITSQNSNSTDEISWMVVAERNDEWFRDSEMTDDSGNTIVEKLKPIIE